MYTSHQEVIYMRRTTLAAAICAVAALPLAGCQAGSGGPTVTTANPTVPAPATTGTVQPPVATTSPRSTPVPPRPSAVKRVCGDTSRWNTAPQGEDVLPVREALLGPTPGSHDTCDRVRFDVKTAAKVGWDVRYVPELTADGSGKHLDVAGGAVLQVTIQAPLLSQVTTHEPGDVLADRAEWPAMVQIVFAGSHESVSSFGLGVRKGQRPFRVWTKVADGVRSIIVDIAYSG
ncbi:MAG TPA: hypothetical protein VMT30_04660 [Candidatus Saccharimonadia bacterium]|nr:hypothetical protein [Candidatus Saccharimonadia bacterium]